jgi:hypothetical protein
MKYCLFKTHVKQEKKKKKKEMFYEIFSHLSSSRNRRIEISILQSTFDL